MLPSLTAQGDPWAASRPQPSTFAARILTDITSTIRLWQVVSEIPAVPLRVLGGRRLAKTCAGTTDRYLTRLAKIWCGIDLCETGG